MNTKQLLLAGLAAGMALQLCPTAAANPITVTGSASPALVIPDNDANGIASPITLSSAISAITSVQVTVDVAGDPTAFNGDYYAYLQYSSGLVVLLNNLGGGSLGSPGDGFNVTFSDAAPNISSAPGLDTTATLTGTYAPQAGSLNSTFSGLDPNGTWWLFLADKSPGGVGALESWSLQVTGNAVALPDSGSALGLLLLAAGSLGLWSLRKRRVRPHFCD